MIYSQSNAGWLALHSEWVFETSQQRPRFQWTRSQDLNEARN